MEIELAQALYTLGKLSDEKASSMCVSLLEAGFDTPAIRELAGFQSAAHLDADVLFGRVLSELNRPAMPIRRAALVVAMELARRKRLRRN